MYPTICFQICSLITRNICHSDAPQLLTYLYQGMTQNSSMEVKRFKVILYCFKHCYQSYMYFEFLLIYFNFFSLSVSFLFLQQDFFPPLIFLSFSLPSSVSVSHSTFSLSCCHTPYVIIIF